MVPLMPHKKLFHASLLAAALAAAFLAPGARCDDAPVPRSTMGGTGPIANELDEQTTKAVTRGLEFLAKNQSGDGTFNGGGENVAVTAIAGIAFLANGSTPDQGPYGTQTKKALDYILANCQESGLVATNGMGSPMYGHGFATLFLAEAYGESPKEEVKEKLQKAIKLMVQTQNKEGGWRYQPAPNDADLSVTICQIMALRAARNAGIKVPGKTIERAVDYVKKSQEPDGGFRYMLQSGGSAYPRSAAGVCCLQYMGIYEGTEIKKGLEYLMKALPGKSNLAMAEGHYFYANYYATQACFMAGGDSWNQYWPAIKKELLGKQVADGSWQGEAGVPYATAMACIMLQVPNRLLPVLQR